MLEGIKGTFLFTLFLQKVKGTLFLHVYLQASIKGDIKPFFGVGKY